MPLAIRKSVACILVVLLTIIYGVGEGLHWIPGCGHGIRVGNLVLLLGIDVPDTPRSADDRPHVERPQGQDIPIYDEDQCAICSAIGLSCTSADSASFVLAVPLVQDLPPVALCGAPSAIIYFFRARAPPLV